MPITRAKLTQPWVYVYDRGERRANLRNRVYGLYVVAMSTSGEWSIYHNGSNITVRRAGGSLVVDENGRFPDMETAQLMAEEDARQFVEASQKVCEDNLAELRKVYSTLLRPRVSSDGMS